MNDEQPEPRKNVRADSLGRADQAWRARIAGATWQQAAEVAGFENASNAFRGVKSVYDSTPSPEREELRKLWRERLEVLWRQALRDATDRRSGAITAAVRVQQAAAAMDGLDEPSRLEVYNPSREQLEQWVDLVVGEKQPALEEADIFGFDDDVEEIESAKMPDI